MPTPPQTLSDRLPRYGIQWNGPDEPIATPMPDGYWTPWHEAATALDRRDALIAAAEALEAEHAYGTSAEFWQKMRDLFALLPPPEATKD